MGRAGHVCLHAQLMLELSCLHVPPCRYELEPLDLMSDEEEGEELAEGVRKEVQEGEAAQQKAPAAKQKQ